MRKKKLCSQALYKYPKELTFPLRVVQKSPCNSSHLSIIFSGSRGKPMVCGFVDATRLGKEELHVSRYRWISQPLPGAKYLPDGGLKVYHKGVFSLMLP